MASAPGSTGNTASSRPYLPTASDPPPVAWSKLVLTGPRGMRAFREGGVPNRPSFELHLPVELNVRLSTD
jgi:hypothetical protein